MTTDTAHTQIDPNQATAFEVALEARREQLAALPEELVARRLRLDVATVSTTAGIAVGQVEELREILVEEFGSKATALLDGLDTTARAARQADVELGTMDEASELAALHREVLSQHERLILDADSLAVRGFIARERLAGSRDLRSYQGALNSLLGVIAVLRSSWADIEAHTPVKMADLARASDVAAKMGSALSKRQHGALRSAAIETRARALSLLVREYELLRRMVTYVRWFEDDADRFMPSLYAGRGGRGKKDVEPEPDDDTEDLTPVPGPVPNNGGPAFVS
jgi:hypothetical protein